MTDPIKHYIKRISDLYRTQQATEHSYRAELQALIESQRAHLTVINEAKRIACGAPDLTIQVNEATIGYVEAKDIGKPLAESEKSDQLKRYLKALKNLILTDYLEFRWFVDGELRHTVSLGQVKRGKLELVSDIAPLSQLLGEFLARGPEQIGSAHEIAQRMAQLTHLLRDMVITIFEREAASAMLSDLRAALAQTLLPDLDLPSRVSEFADIYAQTIAYGLFAARCNHRGARPFSRNDAAAEIPKTNPFLRRLFTTLTGPDLDDEPYVGLVTDLVQLLANADMEAILADFGRATQQEDPIVHFYETFLAAYDPKLRELRGVYYTPEPVVSYMVRSVDHLLKSRFQLADGLTDTATITYGEQTLPRMLLLDPAVGTGTFLYGVIEHIRRQFQQRRDAGMWSRYVKEYLLKRLYGFELLMVPYAVAHFKLAWQLANPVIPPSVPPISGDFTPPSVPPISGGGFNSSPDVGGGGVGVDWRYQFDSDERLKIYLTNTLEEVEAELPRLMGLFRIITEEAKAAADIKQNLPILVVMGNPPYSYESSNRGKWISNLIRDYYQVDGKPLGERNPKGLQDDYVKFIRWGQARIEQTGSGILAFITNHGYLDNPTFRGMRQSLMQTFDEIYLLDLHGNAKKKERALDGGKDENVFDIQQGVAIGLFVKHALPHPLAPSPTSKRGNFDASSLMSGKGRGDGVAKVYHAHLRGNREHKYRVLAETDITQTAWQELAPQSPFYLFIPQNVDSLDEYEAGWKVTDIFPVNSMGIATARDDLTIRWSSHEVLQTVKHFTSLPVEAARDYYNLGNDTRDWKVSLAQKDINESKINSNKIKPISYRPFDIRYTYYTGQTTGFICMPRYEVMQHLLYTENLSICFIRRSRREENSNFFVTSHLVDKSILSSADNANIAPLYLYPANQLFNTAPWPVDAHGRVPNLNPDFVADMEARLGLRFLPHPPAPSPTSGKGSQNSPSLTSGSQNPPSPMSERGPGGEVEQATWQTSPDLWAKLKPLAREMRHEPTMAEDALWQEIRNKKLLDLKFRRQHAIDRFIVDFYCREAQLIIEVDGASHDYTQAEDAIRQEFLESQGYRVIRFSNTQVLQEMKAVLEQIALTVQNLPHPPTPSPTSGKGSQNPPSPMSGSQNPPSPMSERGPGGEVDFFTPEDIFHYIYAVFHSPTYRERYAEFLKIDFPRVPLTNDPELFWALAGLGQQLVKLHLMEARPAPITNYPVGGDNVITSGYPKYEAGRVYINKTQYFDGVEAAVWEFQIGGYQVLQKWLKDRRDRVLEYDDLTHYAQIVVALSETMRLMSEIDAVIPAWPM